MEDGAHVTDDETLRLEPFEIVLLQPGQPHPRALDGTPVDLSDTHELTEVEQQALLDSAVQVFPEDLAEPCYEAVDYLPVPAIFERTGWLNDHRVLLLDESARTGAVCFELHETYGLRIEENV